MRKYLVIGLILIVGCATTYPPYNGPKEYVQQAETIVLAVAPCFSKDYSYQILISESDAPVAWAEAPNKIGFTHGLFKKYDDASLKFIIAHEIAHLRLGHHAEVKGVSIATTGAMIAANFVIPGVGLLNHAVNPAVTRSFSRSAELEADKKAAEACIKCLKISPDKIIQTVSQFSGDGGFWSTHPSWEDRIKNISAPQ